MTDPSQESASGASSSAKVLQVNIVSADHPVWSGHAASVTIPAAEGGMGIMPDHEPMMTVIKQGTVVVRETQGGQHAFKVTDGFISFDSNRLTIAVGRAKSVEKTDALE